MRRIAVVSLACDALRLWCILMFSAAGVGRERRARTVHGSRVHAFTDPTLKSQLPPSSRKRNELMKPIVFAALLAADRKSTRLNSSHH